jgi:hypothetical protein
MVEMVPRPGRKIDPARLDHFQIVLAEFVAVSRVSCAQQGMNVPPRPFTNAVDVAGMERHQDQIGIGQSLRRCRCTGDIKKDRNKQEKPLMHHRPRKPA